MDRQEEARLPPRLDDYVGADNPVRAIDAYVDALDLRALGFDRTAPNRTEAGQPPFPPSALLKPACTATSTGCASSRALEKDCQRNLEAVWLVKGLRPGYRTIVSSGCKLIHRSG